MKLRPIRIAIGAIAAESLALLGLLLIIPVVMFTNPPSTIAAEPLVQRLADWIIPIGGFLSCAIAGRWATRKLDSDHRMNGFVLGVSAAVLFLAFLIALEAPFRIMLVLAVIARPAAGWFGGWMSERRNVRVS
jgi:hypothetical protein